MSGDVVLTVVAGSVQGKKFTFDSHDTFLFGRQDDCHICLPNDQAVSRHHFLMEVNPPQVCVRDLGSLNGTYVNKHKYGGRAEHETPVEGAKHSYPQVDLKDGDEIRVGKTTLRVQVNQSDKRENGQRVCCQNCGQALASVNSEEQSGQLCGSCRQQAKKDPLLLFQNVEARTSSYYKLSNYAMERKLGEGGMGEVHLVKHRVDGKLAALKVMLSKVAVDAVARHDFLREIDNTRKLQHPHVVKFLDSGIEKSTFYFLIEFCEGGSVDQLMKWRGGRLTLSEAGPIMLGALEGLAYAHAQGVVHRDIKPQNILLSGSDGKWQAKIADLGLAKDYISAGFGGMTITGAVGGSLAFMPREQVVSYKYVKPVSDVWAMGASFYYMLTGSLPRPTQGGGDPIHSVLSGPVISLRQCDPTIPKNIAAMIDRSLAMAMEDRYQTAGEMLKALKAVLK